MSDDTWMKIALICFVIGMVFLALSMTGCANREYFPVSDNEIPDMNTYAPVYQGYEPQNVWVRTLGQPDQLVTVLPAY